MRIVSGVQPSGEIHLGNYLGALRHWASLQTEAECLYFVADLHVLTAAQDPDVLRRRILATAALLIAIGIDPQRSALFVQSHVSEHTELAWVLGCVATVGELQRMTQFKDKTSRRELAAATLGLFAYPVLQAADVLLYRADRVLFPPLAIPPSRIPLLMVGKHIAATLRHGFLKQSKLFNRHHHLPRGGTDSETLAAPP